MRYEEIADEVAKKLGFAWREPFLELLKGRG
jgi:hypothetical protein